MDQQVLLDKLSEFLMVEQGGLELYRVDGPVNLRRLLPVQNEPCLSGSRLAGRQDVRG